MNWGSKILAAAVLAIVPAGLAAAAPLGTAAPAVPTVQTVDWRGGHWHGEYFPDRGAFWGPGFGYAAPYAYSYDYDYGPGYSTYAYEPGYSYGFASPGYSDYGYSAPDVGVAPGRDIGYCEQRFRSYDPASGTYLGYDGIRHPCP
jgi:hypothetical protein